MQFVSSFAAVAIKSFQENSDVVLDRKQFSSVPRRGRHEISSRRRDESSRLHGKTSAAGSRTSLSTLNWHEWNSCPSRLFFPQSFSFWNDATPFEIHLNVQ
jgi:hypothetical protein